MILVSQGGDRVFFTDDECHVGVKKDKIVYVRNDGKESVLGEYRDNERAREVFYQAINEMMNGATGLWFAGE